MKRPLLARMALAALAVGALVMVANPGPRAQENANTIEIKVTARKYKFEPNTITVKKGQQVKLIITAVDHDHGFKLDDFNINQRLKKGDPTTVEFTADKAGTFPFECSVFCGLGHKRMKGKLVVEE